MRDRPKLSDRFRGKTGSDLMNEFKKEFEDSKKWFADRPSSHFSSFKRVRLILLNVIEDVWISSNCTRSITLIFRYLKYWLTENWNVSHRHVQIVTLDVFRLDLVSYCFSLVVIHATQSSLRFLCKFLDSALYFRWSQMSMRRSNTLSMRCGLMSNECTSFQNEAQRWRNVSSKNIKQVEILSETRNWIRLIEIMFGSFVRIVPKKILRP